MRKKIQKYLAGEREGFSLVELIIVIAIMAILIGVVTLAVLPNIAKSKESKDITALDSLLSSVNNAVASQQVSTNGSFVAAITNNKADISAATTPSGDTKSKAVRDEVVKLMGKKEIPFSSSKVCSGSNSLICQWVFDTNTGEITIETAVVPTTSATAGTAGVAVVGDYMGAFASSNGKPIAGATPAP